MEELLDKKLQWCYFLKNSGKMNLEEQKNLVAKGGDMTKAVNSLWDLSKNAMAREVYRAEQKRAMDELSNREEARDEGREEGEAIGEARGIKKTALKMIQDKVDIEIIKKYTGLTKKEITSLKQTLKQKK